MPKAPCVFLQLTTICKKTFCIIQSRMSLASNFKLITGTIILVSFSNTLLSVSKNQMRT